MMWLSKDTYEREMNQHITCKHGRKIPPLHIIAKYLSSFPSLFRAAIFAPIHQRTDSCDHIESTDPHPHASRLFAHQFVSLCTDCVRSGYATTAYLLFFLDGDVEVLALPRWWRGWPRADCGRHACSRRSWWWGKVIATNEHKCIDCRCGDKKELTSGRHDAKNYDSRPFHRWMNRICKKN